MSAQNAAKMGREGPRERVCFFLSAKMEAQAKIDGKPSQKGIKKHLVKTMSEDTRPSEDGPGISDAGPSRWTPYPFNSGQPGQDTDHIFEIPSLLFGGKPPSFPAIYANLFARFFKYRQYFDDKSPYPGS